MKMDEHRIPGKVLEWKPLGWKMRGRPRKRLIDDVEDDLRMIGVKRWRILAGERSEWDSH